MGYDISDDAESRFSEREAGWEESQRVVCYKDCELACEAVYRNRVGKPKNFLELSNNDVEFCRNVVQATAHFLFVFFVLYAILYITIWNIHLHLQAKEGIHAYGTAFIKTIKI